MTEPVRYLQTDDFDTCHPVHAVWELTLACDLKCIHCGSRAAKARPDELHTEECLDVVQQLARLGCREVTLIGGEAYLRKDWTTIIRAIKDAGMLPSMQTGGRNLTEERLEAAIEAGLGSIGFSIDGTRETHDEIRGVQGSFDNAIRAARMCRARGLKVGMNTQITSRIKGQLRELFDLFLDVGVDGWQIQLTVAMGRAADNDHLLIQPYELLELMPTLFELHQEGQPQGLLLIPGNNIGYFGPIEAAWRGGGRDHVHWIGCNAGLNTLGIEADGTIKGCPSLPTASYSGGNVRDLSIEAIWKNSEALAFNRTRGRESLWGFCGDCYYADICRGGCTWTTHTMFGRPGNNPYCHHRALELAKQGKRERVVKTREAEGVPFDHGAFEIVVEPIDAPIVPREVDAKTQQRRTLLKVI